MNESELVAKIDALNVDNEFPYIRIVQVGNQDEYGLEGNKSGLQKMAAGLLKLSIDNEDSGIENLLHESTDIYLAYSTKTKNIEHTFSEVALSFSDKLIGQLLNLALLTIPVLCVLGLIKLVELIKMVS